MATNQRVSNGINDLGHEKLSPNGLTRTVYAPGKTNGSAGDANWETDFRIPVGVASIEESGSIQVTRVRSHLIGRNIMCDQTINAPVSTGTKVVTVTSAPEWGADTPSHTLTKTNTQDIGGRNGDVVEKTDGYDYAEGA